MPRTFEQLVADLDALTKEMKALTAPYVGERRRAALFRAQERAEAKYRDSLEATAKRVAALVTLLRDSDPLRGGLRAPQICEALRITSAQWENVRAEALRQRLVREHVLPGQRYVRVFLRESAVNGRFDQKAATNLVTTKIPEKEDPANAVPEIDENR